MPVDVGHKEARIAPGLFAAQKVKCNHKARVVYFIKSIFFNCCLPPNSSLEK
jgi:hypothetical protein